MNRYKIISCAIMLFLAALLTGGCARQEEHTGLKQVVASTSILGDVVRQIAGEHIEVIVLLPLDSDPHSFQPVPQDIVAIEKANLVFINGLGLEEFFGDLISDMANQEKIIEVSQGIAPLYFGETAEEHADHAEDIAHEHQGVDPHVWMSPLNVSLWVDPIAAALSELDPTHAAEFNANAQAYQAELEALHAWAFEKLADVPEERRLLVSDHETFNYLAEAYGLQVVGSLTGFSSLAEASAQDLAALEAQITALGVPAIFISTTVPSRLAERVAADTGVQVVRVYTGSLSGPDGPAATYLEMMRTTISRIADALKG